MNRNNLKGTALLLSASLIWGLAFVAQSDAAQKIPPFIFNALRSYIAVVFLFVLSGITDLRKHQRFFPPKKSDRKSLLLGGLICGILLAVAVNFQQFGLAAYPEGTASAARGGFLTALYVIFVPLTAIFTRKKPHFLVLFGVLIAAVGIYMLCLSEGIGSIYFGDILMLFCALCFTAHILSVDRFSAGISGIKLSLFQFLFCATTSLIMSIIFEKIVWADILNAAPQILYLGIVSSGIGYTLQIVGQKFAEATVASISMSFESVFAALFGWLISGDVLSSREIIGCLLVFAAIIIAQMPDLFRKKAAPNNT